MASPANVIQVKREPDDTVMSSGMVLPQPGYGAAGRMGNGMNSAMDQTSGHMNASQAPFRPANQAPQMQPTQASSSTPAYTQVSNHPPGDYTGSNARHTVPRIFGREYLSGVHRTVAKTYGLRPPANQNLSASTIYADQSVTLVLESFLESLIALKNHRIQSTNPRPPPFYPPSSSSTGQSEPVPMWRYELVDEPFNQIVAINDAKKKLELAARRERRERVDDWERRKERSRWETEHGIASGSGAAATGGARADVGAVNGSSGGGEDVKEEDSAQNTPNKPGKKLAKTAEQKEEEKRKLEEAKRRKAAPDVEAMNSTANSAFAGLGKKRKKGGLGGGGYDWLAGGAGPELIPGAGKMNKKRKGDNGEAVKAEADVEGKDSDDSAVAMGDGQAGIGKRKLPGAGPSSVVSSSKLKPVVPTASSFMSSVNSSGSYNFPEIPDTITNMDIKLTLEQYIRRGGPLRAMWERKWEEVLVEIGKEEQRWMEGEVGVKIPKTHPGDEVEEEGGESA